MTTRREAMGTSDDYWVNHCEGCHVEWEGSRVGVVEEVVLDDRGDAALLHVRGGLFGTSAFDVPVQDISDVLPARLRLVVNRRPSRFHPDAEGRSARRRINAALGSRTPT
jgi:hypothetical protein